MGNTHKYRLAQPIHADGFIFTLVKTDTQKFSDQVDGRTNTTQSFQIETKNGELLARTIRFGFPGRQAAGFGFRIGRRQLVQAVFTNLEAGGGTVEFVPARSLPLDSSQHGGLVNNLTLVEWEERVEVSQAAPLSSQYGFPDFDLLIQRFEPSSERYAAEEIERLKTSYQRLYEQPYLEKKVKVPPEIAKSLQGVDWRSMTKPITRVRLSEGSTKVDVGVLGKEGVLVFDGRSYCFRWDLEPAFDLHSQTLSTAASFTIAKKKC